MIPLQASGVIDTDLSNVSAAELLRKDLENLQPKPTDTTKEGEYAVRHGLLPVNGFGRPRKGEERPFDPDRESF